MVTRIRTGRLLRARVRLRAGLELLTHDHHLPSRKIIARTGAGDPADLDVDVFPHYDQTPTIETVHRESTENVDNHPMWRKDDHGAHRSHIPPRDRESNPRPGQPGLNQLCPTGLNPFTEVRTGARYGRHTPR